VLERLEQLVREPDFVGLVGQPCVGQPLDTVRVRIMSGREASVGQGKLAEHVAERLLDDLAIALAPGDDPRVQVGRGEDGVVVEHLLEVRDEPAIVHGIAMEASADDVVEATGGHSVERRGDHRQRLLAPAAQEELERRRRRKLRGAPEPPECRLEARGDRMLGICEQR
jgi:hypothetical protein